jgi:hypothetical protein
VSPDEIDPGTVLTVALDQGGQRAGASKHQRPVSHLDKGNAAVSHSPLLKSPAQAKLPNLVGYAAVRADFDGVKARSLPDDLPAGPRAEHRA